MTPAQLAVSLEALEQLDERAHRVDRQWQLRLERARYEADVARRRFLSVEPENRLIARNLEHDWSDNLTAVAQLEREADFNLQGQFFPPGAPVAAVARNPDQLDLFITGNDGKVYTSWWSQDPIPGIPANAQAILDAHNFYRSKHCVSNLTWSPQLVASAQVKASNIRPWLPSSWPCWSPGRAV